MKIDTSKLTDLILGGVDSSDYPKFCDAYVESACYKGKRLTFDELDWVNSEHPEIAQENAFESLL